MKELTIEQKAQRYDEAVKRAKRMFSEKELNYLFPELKGRKESGDEKIKKELLSFLKKGKPYHCPNSAKRQEWATWLEKQGEQKSDEKVEQQFHEGDWVVISTSDGRKIVQQIASIVYSSYDQPRYITSDCKWFDNKTKARLWDITKDAKDGDVIYSKHNTESFEWIGIFKSLDKENKRVFFYGFWHDMIKTFSVCRNEAYVLYNDFSPATKEQRDLLFQKMKEAGYEWDAEKKELKKVEPKFKVGDWITNGDRTEQISEIDNNYYRCFNGNHGYGVYVMTIESTDTDFHLWTVEDAKAGDVLVDEDNNIGIHKDIEGLYWNSYIYLGCDGKLRGFSIGGGHKQANTRPATKEQCDFFFKKMKEADYEWDAEVKELKKIELKFKVGDWITNGKFIVGQIISIGKEYYHYICNGIEQPLYIPNAYKYHLWTIKDAKDGDVLVNGNEIVIFKENNFNQKNLNGCMFVHCSLNNKNGYWRTIGGINPSNYVPATKEQRDILMKAIADAGYTFDAEKKELKKIDTYCQENCKGFQETGKCFCDGECKAKKEHDLQDNNFHQIEQKPVDKLQPMFNVDDIISDGISEVKIVNIDKKNKCYGVTNDEIENDAHICNWVIYFKDQEKWKIKNKDNKKHSQSKQEWSEEDERWFKETELMCLYFSNDTDYRDKFFTWLKSIKDRYTWKPSKE